MTTIPRRARYRTFGSLADSYPRLHLSIRAKILLSLCFVILLMGSINALLLLQALTVSRQYDAIITNIATANSISRVKTDIDAAMWGIVAGNTPVRRRQAICRHQRRQRQTAPDAGQYRFASRQDRSST